MPSADDSLDAWDTDILGNAGWNRSTLRKYYAKAFTLPTLDEPSSSRLGVDGWSDHSDVSSGPLQLCFAGSQEHPIRRAWADTFKATGYPVSHNPFTGASVGAFSCLSSIDPATKVRNSSAHAYYNPVKDRANLKVVTNAYVEKILLDSPHSSRYTGVKYRYNGTAENVVTVRKEVILAAGAVQSPKVLELSGIGDAALLNSHGIKSIVDLPGVGGNLQDHLVCGISFEAAGGVEILDPLLRQEPAAVEKAMQDYATTQSGLLTSIGLHTYAYLPVISEEGRSAIKQLLDEQRTELGKKPS